MKFNIRLPMVLSGMPWLTVWHAGRWNLSSDKASGEEMFTYKVQMYRVSAQPGYYLDMLKKEAKLSKEEEAFLEKVRKKHIDSIVYWEIMAGEEPYIMFMLSAKEKQSIVEYIRKYVYQSRIN